MTSLYKSDMFVFIPEIRVPQVFTSRKQFAGLHNRYGEDQDPEIATMKLITESGNGLLLSRSASV